MVLFWTIITSLALGIGTEKMKWGQISLQCPAFPLLRLNIDRYIRKTTKIDIYDVAGGCCRVFKFCIYSLVLLILKMKTELNGESHYQTSALNPWTLVSQNMTDFQRSEWLEFYNRKSYVLKSNEELVFMTCNPPRFRFGIILLLATSISSKLQRTISICFANFSPAFHS